MLRIVTLPVGLLQTNCYLLFDADAGWLGVVDPGAEAERIVAAAREFPAARTVMLLTHAHVDHISAAGAVAAALGIREVCLADADRTLYRSPNNALEPYLPAARDLPETTAEITLPGLTVLPLPGHTPGGAGFYFPADRALFQGDTLFAGSIGRTDLPGGDYPTLARSIRERIFTLPDDTAVYAGHGGPTTVGREKRSNPFIGQ